ncbi:MAG: thioredoxin domain-containing protein [Oligoflexales bacterium]
MKKILSFISILAICGSAFGEDLYKANGKKVTTGDLAPKDKLKLNEAEQEIYQVKSRIVDEILLDNYFAELAKKKNKSLEDIQKENLLGGEPSEGELKKFYEENKARIPYPFDQVKPQLTEYVKQQKVQEKREKLLTKIKKEQGFQLLLAAPVAPKIEIETKGFASRGKDGAKVTVVEFADFRCGHCKEASVAFKKLYKDFEKDVQFVFIDFPIIKGSEEIAKGSHCAAEQNKYWEFHEFAYDNQGSKDVEQAATIAKKVSLDEGKFKQCMGDKKAEDLVAKGKAEGEKVGVKGTPTIFINGKHYMNHPTYEGLSEAIKLALKGGNS